MLQDINSMNVTDNTKNILSAFFPEVSKINDSQKTVKKYDKWNTMHSFSI
jgi:hypothetical protein